MRFRAKEIARAVAGDLTDESAGDVEITTGVAIDSRLVTGGELFVPIVAERDGHEFVAAAVAAGASAYLSQPTPPPDVDAPAIVVEDTGRALLALGAHARSRLRAQVIGVTGSVG